MILKGGNVKILKAVMDAVIPKGGPFMSGAADYNLLPLVGSYLRVIFRLWIRLPEDCPPSF